MTHSGTDNEKLSSGSRYPNGLKEPLTSCHAADSLGQGFKKRHSRNQWAAFTAVHLDSANQ